MQMTNPPHPSELLKEEALGLGVNETADRSSSAIGTDVELLGSRVPDSLQFTGGQSRLGKSVRVD